MNNELHDEIDALGIEIEREIEKNRQFLDELPEFDPKYRRMQEAQAAQDALNGVSLLS